MASNKKVDEEESIPSPAAAATVKNFDPPQHQSKPSNNPNDNTFDCYSDLNPDQQALLFHHQQAHVIQNATVTGGLTPKLFTGPRLLFFCAVLFLSYLVFLVYKLSSYFSSGRKGSSHGEL